MCGRFTLTRAELGEIARELEASFDETIEWHARYNIAPTDAHPIVIAAPGGAQRASEDEPRRLVRARWGISQAPLVINARSETAMERPLFREAFAQRRCLVPADGFYEWQGAKKERQPLWFHSPSGRLLLMAGLYEPVAGGLAFTTLTTPANAQVAVAHDRMPALLDRDQATAWLRAPRPELLRPASDGMLAARIVSDRVSSTANDDPDCLAPARPRAQLDLF